jgi:hypothetical protein
MVRQHTDRRAFCMRWSLSTCIHAHFPLVTVNTPGAHSALHPFLYGYEGLCQVQTKKRSDYYSVAHRWGGLSIFRSYTMAWTAQADFKLQAHLNLPGGICQFRATQHCKLPTRRHSKSADLPPSYNLQLSILPAQAPWHSRPQRSLSLAEPTTTNNYGIHPCWHV